MGSELKKRPAHEVILEKLERDFENFGLYRQGEGQSLGHMVLDLFHMEALCEVLSEMIIPPEHRARIANKLLEFRSTFPEAQLGTDMLGETANLILVEDEKAAKVEHG